MKLIIFIVVIFICRLLMNTYYLYRSIFLRNIYVNFWTKESNNATQYTSEIKSLFSKAGIKDKNIGYAQPLGYSQIQTGSASIIDNMFVNHAGIVSATVDFFDEAIGTFKRRIFENFNPIFWIETLIYLPKNIFQYLGLKEDSVFIKIIQIVYWITCLFYSIYNEQINKIIQDFLSSLFR